MRMSPANQGEDRSEPHEQSATAEKADRRISALRRVYDEGYISVATLEKLTRSIRANLKRDR
jgi:hypothetical protein